MANQRMTKQEAERRFIPIVKLSVWCEVCGHQAIVAAPMRGSRLPVLYCGWCGDRDPLVEHIRY
jgi:transcription elongation factor Elf1